MTAILVTVEIKIVVMQKTPSMFPSVFNFVNKILTKGSHFYYINTHNLKLCSLLLYAYIYHSLLQFGYKAIATNALTVKTTAHNNVHYCSFCSSTWYIFCVHVTAMPVHLLQRECQQKQFHVRQDLGDVSMQYIAESQSLQEHRPSPVPHLMMWQSQFQYNSTFSHTVSDCCSFAWPLEAHS